MTTVRHHRTQKPSNRLDYVSTVQYPQGNGHARTHGIAGRTGFRPRVADADAFASWLWLRRKITPALLWSLSAPRQATACCPLVPYFLSMAALRPVHLPKNGCRVKLEKACSCWAVTCSTSR